MSKADESLALLPSGFVDILPPYAGREAQSIRKLMDCFGSYGYQLIKPPLLEFEDSLLAPGPGERLSSETFRLMDPVSHRMLGVRSDITAQIARIVSSRLIDEPRPLRLTYANDVLRTKGSQMRTERQFTQVGCELVDDSDQIHADIEICMLPLLGLKELGITDITLDLTIPSFVASMIGGIADEDQGKAQKAVMQRDVEVLNSIGCKYSKLLALAMQASGDAISALEELEEGDFPSVIKQELSKLKLLCSGIENALKDLGIDNVNLSIDLIEQSGFEYHKGYGFTLFSAQSKGELGRGGAYDICFGDKGNAQTQRARGFTLYMDTISKFTQEHQIRKCVLVPVDTPWHVLKGLQDQGWITLRAIEDGQIIKECTHIYKDGEIKQIS